MWNPEIVEVNKEKVITNLRRLAAMDNVNGDEQSDDEEYKTYVPCVLGDTVTTGMCDTGNTYHCVVSEDLARATGADLNNLKKVPGKDRVGTAGEGEGLEVLGQVRRRLMLKLPHRTRPLYIKPMVIRNLSMDLNLSGPWMEKHGMKIDPGKKITYDGQDIPFISKSEVRRGAGIQHASCALYTVGDIVIPPKTIVYAPTVLPQRMQEQYRNEKIIVMGNKNIEERHKIRTFRRTRVKLQDEGGKTYAKVGFLNRSKRKIKIPKGTFYGQGFPTTDSRGIKKTPWKICVLDRGELPPQGEGKEPPCSRKANEDGVPPESAKIRAQHAQFEHEGQTKELPDWMHGPTTKQNFEQRCQHLTDTFKLDENPNLKAANVKQQVLMVLLHFWSAFSWDGRIGRTDLIHHHLTLKAGAKPVRQKVRPLHPALEPSLQEQLLKWLRNGVIEASDSDWNSNLLPCYKPGGEVRWVLDFTSLNRVCEIETFPVGDVGANLSRLAKSRYYSMVDIVGAYHVVPIHPEDRHKSAFCTPWNVFHFRMMPFGMAAAGATFCRLNQLIAGRAGITSDECLSYIDDLLILGATADEHVRNLFKTIKAYSEAGMLINPKKSAIMQSQVKYLGYLIDSDGVKTLPEYVDAVVKWELPTSKHKARVFMGKAVYYKRFCRNFAQIAAPMNEVLKKDGEYGSLTDHEEFRPSEAYKKSFEQLKQALVAAPTLAHPRFDRLDQEQFVLDTDWSEDTLCISGCLHQRQSETRDGKEIMVERPIAFMSKKLGETAKMYSPMKGELAAVIYYLDYFYFYATVGTIVIRTDHAALTALRDSTEKRGQWARWRTRLACYNYTVEFRKGRDNANADSMSRAPHIQGGPGEELDIFNEAEDGVQIVSIADMATHRFGDHVLDALKGDLVSGIEQIEGEITVEDMRDMQDDDGDIKEIKRMLAEKEVPNREAITLASPERKAWFEVFDQLYISRDGLLRYATEVTKDDGETWHKRNLVALPESAAYDVVKMIHRYYAHIGLGNTLDKAKDKVWSQNMRRIAQQVCDECIECQLKGGKKRDQRHTHVPIRSGAAWDVLSIDFCGPWPRTARGYEHVLTLEDVFTKWVDAIPLRKANAKHAFAALTERFFPTWGLPTAIKSDNGSQFCSKLMEDLAVMLKVELRKSVPLNPASNPVERVHLNIKRALTAVCKNKSKQWDTHLPQILFSLRVAKHSAIGMSPYEMVFGSPPRTRLEHIFGEPPGQQFYNNRHEYVEALKHRIQVAHKWARENISSAVARTRAQYSDKTVTYEIGDKVWLFSPRVSRIGERRKFKSVWSGPWRVTKCLSAVTYKIKPHPLWIRQGEILVSINRLKRFVCAAEDEDTVGYPPAIDQDLIMNGDEAAEHFDDYEPVTDDEEEQNDEATADMPDEEAGDDAFWIDDEYADHARIADAPDSEASEAVTDSEEDDGQPEPPVRNTRNQPRVDYKELHHRGRGTVDALKLKFNRRGELDIDTSELERSQDRAAQTLRALTDQARVLHRQDEASRRQLQRFTESKPRETAVAPAKVIADRK